MASTKVIIVVAVALIAVVGIGAFILLGGMGNDKEYSVNTALAVYGNANNDTTIDKKDIDLIKEIIDGKKDKNDYPFADANGDSYVNSKDIQMVETIIDGTATSVYIQCLNASGDSVIKSVSYPLTNIAVIGTNMVPVVINAGAVPIVAGWYEGNTAYPNLEKVMKENAFSLGKAGRSALSDALWKNFTDRDADLRAKTGTGIQAFFVDHSLGSAITQKIRDDLAAIGIPEIRLAVADPYKDISSSAMIGFLAGGDIQKTSENYAQKSLKVLDEIEKKVSKVKASDKRSYIGISMSNYVCQTESTFGQIGSYVGGVRYGDINNEFAALYKGTGSTIMSTHEALANFAVKAKLGDNPGIDVIFSNRSIDFLPEDKDAVIVSEWEKSVSGGAKGKAMDYFKDLDCYHDLYYIDNLLPGACKLAYAAAALYPSVFSMEDADKVVEDFAKFCPTLDGVTPENSALCFGYYEYVAAKGVA